MLKYCDLVRLNEQKTIKENMLIINKQNSVHCVTYRDEVVQLVRGTTISGHTSVHLNDHHPVSVILKYSQK